jgi:hypothetical protein
MIRDRAELYLQIFPLRVIDQKYITRCKNNPRQRMKLSNSATLLAISTYIHRLGGPAVSDLRVHLHCAYREEKVELPLSMTAAEFLFISNQGTEGEVHYSFVEMVVNPLPVPVCRHAPPMNQPPKLRGRELNHAFPLQLGEVSHSCRITIPLSVSAVPLLPDLRSGGNFSLFAQTERLPPDKDSFISLRKELEIELQAK